ncbi:hypothetical protein GW17_00058028 [Ensete ventricosum]|nr:hypothetical protein GW17_00058028 [Ensete ventricosum]
MQGKIPTLYGFADGRPVRPDLRSPIVAPMGRSKGDTKHVGEGSIAEQYYHGSLCLGMAKQLYCSPFKVLIDTCAQNEVMKREASSIIVEVEALATELTYQLKDIEQCLIDLTKQLKKFEAIIVWRTSSYSSLKS